MTGKEYMHKIRKTRRAIRLLEEQIERDTIMAAGVGAIRYDKDHVQTSPVKDRMTDIVANIIEATSSLKEEIHKLQKYEAEARMYLVQLPEEYERALSYHYLDCFPWNKISEVMGYEEHYIYELKNKALDELTKILNNS